MPGGGRVLACPQGLVFWDKAEEVLGFENSPGQLQSCLWVTLPVP